jgi:polysaccharide biosynthesis protein PslH
VVYPNALPMAPCLRPEKQDVVVFSGNLEYHPNIMAVRFFRREIWPLLRARWPDLVWRLVGKNAHAVRRFTEGDPRIQVTGPVADAIVELAPAKVAVAPLLAGSGTRLKILEAWAAGCAVVSTSLGAEGLDARDGEHLFLADDAAGFAGAVSKLLESAELRVRVAAAGRELYERCYTWQAAWARLDL